MGRRGAARPAAVSHARRLPWPRDPPPSPTHPPAAAPQFAAHPLACLTLASFVATNTGDVARKQIKVCVCVRVRGRRRQGVWAGWLAGCRAQGAAGCAARSLARYTPHTPPELPPSPAPRVHHPHSRTRSCCALWTWSASCGPPSTPTSRRSSTPAWSSATDTLAASTTRWVRAAWAYLLPPKRGWAWDYLLPPKRGCGGVKVW